MTTTDYLSDEAKMSVSLLSEGSDFDLAVKALEGVAESFTLYKIVLTVDDEDVQPEGSVKLYFPSNGKELTIYRINADGSKTLLQGQVIGSSYVVSTSSVGLFAITQGELTKEVSALDNPFTDVADDHWALDYILKAVALGLFKGTSETKFSPELSMNRGMFVTVLGRLEGVDAAARGATDFADVASDAYYAPYVAWASENGIVNGTSATSFSPDSAIGRQEMATMLYRYISYKGISLAQGEQIRFADEADIAAWAAEAVNALSAAGIISGVGDNQFAPQSTASRAEVAALIVKFVNACMPELLDELETA